MKRLYEVIDAVLYMTAAPILGVAACLVALVWDTPNSFANTQERFGKTLSIVESVSYSHALGLDRV